jgi:hypothetical protein
MHHRDQQKRKEKKKLIKKNMSIKNDIPETKNQEYCYIFRTKNPLYKA